MSVNIWVQVPAESIRWISWSWDYRLLLPKVGSGKLRFFQRAASDLNCWATSPLPLASASFSPPFLHPFFFLLPFPRSLLPFPSLLIPSSPPSFSSFSPSSSPCVLFYHRSSPSTERLMYYTCKCRSSLFHILLTQTPISSWFDCSFPIYKKLKLIFWEFHTFVRHSIISNFASSFHLLPCLPYSLSNSRPLPWLLLFQSSESSPTHSCAIDSGFSVELPHWPAYLVNWGLSVWLFGFLSA